MKVRLVEVRQAVADGADEIDMVINRGAFLAGDFTQVEDEISSVVEACSDSTLKVILETAELESYDKIRAASFIAMRARIGAFAARIIWALDSFWLRRMARALRRSSGIVAPVSRRRPTAITIAIRSIRSDPAITSLRDSSFRIMRWVAELPPRFPSASLGLTKAYSMAAAIWLRLSFCKRSRRRQIWP